jgi:hypothetical protein
MMKEMSRKNKRKVSPKETAYVTKRVLIRAAGPAGRKAAQNAMKTAGYLIKADDGWVVRVNKDGSQTKLIELTTVADSTPIHLD